MMVHSDKFYMYGVRDFVSWIFVVEYFSKYQIEIGSLHDIFKVVVAFILCYNFFLFLMKRFQGLSIQACLKYHTLFVFINIKTGTDWSYERGRGPDSTHPGWC